MARCEECGLPLERCICEESDLPCSLCGVVGCEGECVEDELGVDELDFNHQNEP